jgi:ribosome-associated toxin RatA of RatAB toxin-antitoxin module
MRSLLALSIGMAVSFMPAMTLESHAKSKGVSSSIIIEAPPKVVWQAVADQRSTDPDLIYSKVLSRSGNTSMLEQKFSKLPVIGTATVLFQSNEVPHQRIDYHMVKSDKFKDMSGSWVLKPVDNNTTELQLTNFVDTGLPQMFVNQFTKAKVKQRLALVKSAAERAQRTLASRDPSS